ncbi:MAG: hypothetical protein GXO70_08670 [Acidobacteria bacterium]|nr:hypothetical protein [Acidobacteriota bacterium]
MKSVFLNRTILIAVGLCLGIFTSVAAKTTARTQATIHSPKAVTGTLAEKAVSHPQTASTGDINGNKYSDVIFGEPDYDNRQTNEGLTFVHLDSGSVTTAPSSHTISASAGSDGNISPSGSVSVYEGANQTFTITAGTGYHISDVTVDSASVGAVSSYTFNNVTTDHTISATFAINTYTLTYTAGANGSISGTSPQTVNYGADGTAVTAVPDTGYHFVQWSDGSTANPRTDTNVTAADISVTAVFAVLAVNAHIITASAEAGGSISPSGAVSVNDGANQSFTITADTGYHISDVTVDSSSVGAVSSYTFTNVTADHTISATFAINTYTLTYTAGTNGTISGASPQTVNYGTDGTAVTAVPDTHYHFVQWSDGSTSNTRTDTNVTADISVTAEFAIDTFTVTATAGTNGSLDGTTPSPVTVNYGDTASFTFNADTGYHVASVSGCSGTPYSNSANSAATYTYTTGPITADCTVTATFAINTYTITASAGTGGNISPEGSVSVNYGDSQVFLFTPNTGYHVSNVVVDGTGVGAPGHYTFMNVTAPHTISVAFSANIPPVIDSFTADGTSGNAPLTVNFNCMAHDPDGGSIVRYTWNITGKRGDTLVTSTGALAYRFIIPGDYQVSVTVTDDEGETATATLNTGSAGNEINVADSAPMAIPLPGLIQISQAMKDGSAVIQTTAVNEFDENASVILDAKDADGNTLGTATVTVPAKGSAVLASDSFNNLSYDRIEATADRHLLLFSKVGSDTAKMTAFLSTLPESPIFIPHIAEETDYWHSFAYLSDSNPLMLDVTVAGQTESRTAVPAESIDLNALLPADVDVADAWGKLTAYATNPFSNINSLSGFEMFVKNGGDGAACELVNRGSTRLFIPHVPEETDIFWTGFAFLNTGSSPAAVTATFYDDNGNGVGSETFMIPANSKIKGLMTDLFPNEAGMARWGVIDSDQVITGIEIYGTYNAGICGMVLPTVANTWGILPDVLTGEDNWTGIAITNVSSSDATVTIRLMGADGTVKAEKSVSVAVMHRFKAVLTDLFAGVTPEAGDTVRYSSTAPVVALESSGDLDRTFMTALTGSR